MNLILRKRFWLKALVIFFIFNFLVSAFAPFYSFALTTGPHQPEYTSYEEPGATDMVNLLTGDFTFSLPILEVPGPEGSFQVPLTYNAGIGLDQEASWVGLGWTLNVGAITRSYTGYPDDAKGETQSTTVKDLVGVHGWSSNILGFGQIGWNSIDGHYGSISLLGLAGFSYDESGLSSVNVAGLSLSSNAVSFDPVQFTMAVITVLSYGAGTLAETPVSISTQAAWDVGIGVAASAIFTASTPMAPTSGHWKYTKKEKQKFLHKKYHIYLDQTRYEDMYGVLYLQDSPPKTNSNSDLFVDLSLKVNGTTTTLNRFDNENYKGSASDINHFIPESTNFQDVNNPATLSTDDYSVKAPGISGSIIPYRLDVGSVSVPRKMVNTHYRLMPLAYSNYKVPFVYEGLPSNNYYYHVGAASTITSPSFYHGITATQSNSNPASNQTQTYNLTDVIFGSTARVSSDVSSQKKIPMANHVEWLSNLEIKNTTGAFSSGYMDYFLNGNRQIFRNSQTFATPKMCYSSASSLTTSGVINISATDLQYFEINDPITVTLLVYPEGRPLYDEAVTIETYTYNTQVVAKGSSSITINVSGFSSEVFNKEVDIYLATFRKPFSDHLIGGYSVTAANGLTYHFSLPVYDYDYYTRIEKIGYENTKYSEIKRGEPFVNTWLLTGITGPDFVDRSVSGTANGVIDDADWGYWVKFNYGLHTSDYQWRIPFSDEMVDSKNEYQTYTRGRKQLYYLNSIETKSHVAIFIKEERDDCMGANGETALKLNEIQLVSKEIYKKLVTEYGVPEISGTTVTLLSENISSNARTLISRNTLKQIVFDHNYTLSDNVDNSSTGQGKLTLNRLKILGKEDLKITPDYIFTYGNNQNYSKHKWDGWGMYNGSATSTYSSHTASVNDSDGYAWSLNKVTTPLGSEILVDYERDTYSSIAGKTVFKLSNSFSGNISNHVKYVAVNYLDNVPNQSSYAVGDNVHISGAYSYPCSGTSSVNGNFDFFTTIQSISGNRITFWSSIFQPVCDSQSIINYTIYGNLDKVDLAKKGGNLRVKKITYKDNQVEKKIRYLYSLNDSSPTSSSGVVANEPDYIKSSWQPYPANINIPGYPMTPVMYGRVVVLSGPLTTDEDYHTKQVYEFETPHESMLVFSQSIPTNKLKIRDIALPNYKDYLTLVHNKISDYTSKIGALKSVKIYDKVNLSNPYSESVTTYTSTLTNNNGTSYQGIYSEGTLMFDRFQSNSTTQYHKANRTTMIKYPYVPKIVTTTQDGFTSKTENVVWDFISSAVLEKTITNHRGFVVRSVTRPAYLEAPYSEMGSKANNVTYKNMLTQDCANYVYRADAQGNPAGLISGTVTKWSKNWTYRTYNSTTGKFQDSNEGPDVWRKQSSYAWKGDYKRLNVDGTQSFSKNNEFVFTSGASNIGWQYLGEIKKYNHSSLPLESTNHDNIYTSTITGYNNRVIIGEATNAEYGEVAFSSAEDLPSSGIHFGGEVGLSTGAVKYKSKGQLLVNGVQKYPHSGDAIVELTNSSQKSFVYKTSKLKVGEKYRASVWTNSLNGRIYLVAGGFNTSPTPDPEKRVGDWYLLSYEFTVPAGTTDIEIGVLCSGSTPVWFDDFRLQPIDAAMTCYVFNGLDYFNSITGTPDYKRFEYVLDNNNLFTKYEYNERGQLVKVHVESLKDHEVVLVSESKKDYKRFHISQ